MSMNSTMMERELRVHHDYIKKHIKNSNRSNVSSKEINEIVEKIETIEGKLATIEAGDGTSVSRYNINMNPVASKIGADSGVDDVLAGLNMVEDDDLVTAICKANSTHDFVTAGASGDITKSLLFTVPRNTGAECEYTIDQLKHKDAKDTTVEENRRRYVAQYILADPSNQIRALYALSEKMKYVLNPDYIEE